MREIRTDLPSGVCDELPWKATDRRRDEGPRSQRKSEEEVEHGDVA